MVLKGCLRLLIVLLTTGTSPLLACKYNVRDVGFVDLELTPYRLLLFTDASTSTELIDEFRRASVLSYLDANVVFEAVRTDEPLEDAHAALVRRHDLAAFPAAFLVSPEGRDLALPLSPTPDREEIRSVVDSTVSTPLVDRLRQLLPVAFAAILVNEGADRAGNERAMTAARNAVGRFGLLMDRLPKPVKEPPVVIALTAESRSAERVSRWSLGLSEAPPHEPEIAVVYGRCRRVGPPLRGADLTESGILRVLTILGQDCECDLDRSWMRGPLMPVAWEMEMQRLVVQNLGFDAENPLVRMEVSRILARGPNPSARRIGFDSGGISALGYTEVSIDELMAEERANESSIARADESALPSAPSVAEPTATATPTPEEQAGRDNPEVGEPTDSPALREAPIATATPRFSFAFLVLGGLLLAGGVLVMLRRKSDS